MTPEEAGLAAAEKENADGAIAAMGALAAADAEAKPSLVNRTLAVLWRVLGAAFGETKDGVRAISLGRVAFLAVLTQAMVLWQSMPAGEDLPGSMQHALLALLGYVAGSMPLKALADYISAKKAL